VIKVIVLLRRCADLTKEEFIAYLRDCHSVIAAEGPGFKRHMGG
jgi:hypothetical protein